jgi:hypothetical protein
MAEEPFGLWGTSDPDRVAVSVNRDDPSRVVGHVCLMTRGGWIIEGDVRNQVFPTAREAAQAGLDHFFPITASKGLKFAVVPAPKAGDVDNPICHTSSARSINALLIASREL